MGRPLVSVIMPVRNGERFLAEAIASIVTQSLPDMEMLIVDDDSTDGTAQIISSYRDPRIRCYKMEKNVGASAARNFALERARGIYVTGMDADDISLADRLERQAAFLESHPRVGLVACGWESIDASGRPLFRYDWGDDRAPMNHRMNRQPLFIGPTYFFRRECVDKVGGYRPGFDMNEDWDLCVRISEKYEIGVISGVSYKYRQHGLSACTNKVAKHLRSVILIQRLAEERRLTGMDRLSALPESKIRRFLRSYFYPYDRHGASAGLPLRYFQLTHRIVRNGGDWAMGARYLMKGLLANPFRVASLKLGVRYWLDRRALYRLERVRATPGNRAARLLKAARA